MGEKISIKEVYSSLVQLATEAESITWNRFYNFLMGNSILILAWATMFSITSPSRMATHVLVAICVVGGVSGLIWAALGNRGRKFVYLYIDLGVQMEADATCWQNELDKYKPFTKIKESRETLPYSWSGSRYLLTIGPCVFTLLYILLAVASLIR